MIKKAKPLAKSHFLLKPFYLEGDVESERHSIANEIESILDNKTINRMEAFSALAREIRK